MAEERSAAGAAMQAAHAADVAALQVTITLSRSRSRTLTSHPNPTPNPNPYPYQERWARSQAELAEVRRA